MRTALTILVLLCFTTKATAQLEVRTEAQATAGSGDHNPLWLNANKYGLSSLKTTNGYLRAGLFRPVDTDSTHRWSWGYGADVAVAGGFTSTMVVQQAYADVRWLKGLLTVGSKEQPMQLKNRELSSGSQTLGENARPIPGVRLELPDYWTIPHTHGWLGLKGHIFYGIQTDDGWQEEFTHQRSKYTQHVKLHTKAGYLRIGKKEKPLSVELGLEMGCQYGGKSHGVYEETTENFVTVNNQDGLKGMFHAFLPGGGEIVETLYKNTDGNHLGSWMVRVNYEQPAWGASLYADHYFEDQSSMFFLDYDGYGSGANWDKKETSKWFVYDLRDIMLGVELRLKEFRWINCIVAEYLYTKYQSGSINHDHTITISDHVSGRDNYYNHSIFTGWQHWGQVMGNPLYRSPLYNDNGEIYSADTRFWAWHLGISGTPTDRLHYRMLATMQRGWGTYSIPFPDPKDNVSLLLEGEYRLGNSGWSLRGALGMDFGNMLGDNVGGQLTVRKSFTLKK